MPSIDHVAGAFSRVPAATFKPRISLRVPDQQAWRDFRTGGPVTVIRYGLLPDGSEISLGRTVNVNLSEATEQYWEALFFVDFLSWVPWFLRWAVKRWYPVEVKGYEMTPLPPLEKG